MTLGEPGGWGGLGQRKGGILAVLVLLAVIGAVSETPDGTSVDVGGLFLPLGAVLILLVSPPTFPFVDQWRRLWTAVAGLLIAGLSVVALSVGPGPVRLVAAVLFLLVGVVFVAVAVFPALGARLPRFFPRVDGRAAD